LFIIYLIFISLFIYSCLFAHLLIYLFTFIYLFDYSLIYLATTRDDITAVLKRVAETLLEKDGNNCNM